MKYIFVTGAPGSKWSSVVKNIYYSRDIDITDYSEFRTYYHNASGTMQLMHIGAYFDPGMEFGNSFDRLSEFSKTDCEYMFDQPFSGTGIRIIKSHVLCHHIDFVKRNWPGCPIVLVYRNNDSCLGWWVKCGHFEITYPSYHQYYKNLKNMSTIIEDQNRDILSAFNSNVVNYPVDNIELCRLLGIKEPTEEYRQNYKLSDITVGVINAK